MGDKTRKYLRLFVILSLYISSLVEGKVVSLLVDLGDKVQKGQTLLLLNSREFSQAKADFFRSMTNLNITRKEFERARLLLEKKDIEEEEFLRIKEEYSNAINHYDVSKSNLLLLGLVDSQIELLKKSMNLLKKS